MPVSSRNEEEDRTASQRELDDMLSFLDDIKEESKEKNSIEDLILSRDRPIAFEFEGGSWEEPFVELKDKLQVPLFPSMYLNLFFVES